jgi:hypothetical protein
MEHPKMTAARKRKRPAPPQPLKPTPEWLARYGERQISPTTDAGFKMGRAYLREPWFESLVKRDWTEAKREQRPPAFTVDDLHALRRYRTACEAAMRSEVRSSLNLQRGGTGERGEQPPSLLRARHDVARMEARLGPNIQTMRAVAIDDMSYAQVAMARYGAREVDVYDDATGAFRTRQTPRSGRHPTRIRAEFQAGVKLLSQRAPTAEPAEPAAPPEAPTPAPPTVRDTIDAALTRAEARGTPIAAIAMAPAVSDDIARSLGATGVVATYCGLPVTIREDWRFGWVLVEGG